jgi:hypothetical protein
VLGVPPARSGVYVLALAASPAQAQTLYVGTHSGVYTVRETSPTRWAGRGAVLLGGRSVYALAVSRGPAGTSTLYAGTDNEVYVSRGGRTPFLGRIVPADHRRVGVRVVLSDPLHPLWAYAATDKGLLRTTDGGVHWGFWDCTLPWCTGADVTSLALVVAAPR